MPSQFIRLNCYGAQAGARRKSHENAFDILDEAARVSGSTPHITRPRPPRLLHGMPLEAVRANVAGLVNVVRDRRGARLRRDGTILYAIVVSYPMAWRHLGSVEDLGEYRRWQQAVVEWLSARFGGQLQSVVEHVDEGCPHLHAFVIPPLCPRHRIDHRLHPGHAAREAALAREGDRLAGERAYREGMRLWQDDFHAAVSLYFGHQRIGPRRRRFRRDVALVRQSSDRFFERAETILARLGQRLDADPMLAGGKAAIEIGAIAGLVRDARGRLLSGRSDAMEMLEAALADLVDADQAQAGDRGDHLHSLDLPEPAYSDRDTDDDPRPEEADINPDDDPEPEAPDDPEFDDEWDADADDNDDDHHPEPSDWPDEIDQDS